MERMEFVNQIVSVLEHNYHAELAVEVEGRMPALHLGEDVFFLGSFIGGITEDGLWGRIKMDGTRKDEEFKNVFIHEVGHYISFVKKNKWLVGLDRLSLIEMASQFEDDEFLHLYDDANLYAIISNNIIQDTGDGDRSEDDIAAVEVEDFYHSNDFAKLLSEIGALDYKSYIATQVRCYEDYRKTLLKMSDDMKVKFDAFIEEVKSMGR